MITGLVYYALDATRHAQYLKIGYTTSLKNRMLGLREIAASGQVPIVIALEEGAVEQERERHIQFSDLRSHGEWFHYIGDLQEFVKSLEHPIQLPARPAAVVAVCRRLGSAINQRRRPEASDRRRSHCRSCGFLMIRLMFAYAQRHMPVGWRP